MSRHFVMCASEKCTCTYPKMSTVQSSLRIQSLNTAVKFRGSRTFVINTTILHTRLRAVWNVQCMWSIAGRQGNIYHNAYIRLCQYVVITYMYMPSFHTGVIGAEEWQFEISLLDIINCTHTSHTYHTHTSHITHHTHTYACMHIHTHTQHTHTHTSHSHIRVHAYTYPHATHTHLQEVFHTWVLFSGL